MLIQYAPYILNRFKISVYYIPKYVINIIELLYVFWISDLKIQFVNNFDDRLHFVVILYFLIIAVLSLMNLKSNWTTSLHV